MKPHPEFFNKIISSTMVFSLFFLMGTLLRVNPSMATTTTYYVDFEGGSDANTGTGMASSWKHCPGDPFAQGVPATAKLQPGDTVLFKGGATYRGSITINGSGVSGNPITFKGDGWGAQKAILDGSFPLTGWTPCQSQQDCGGNPNWQNIYYTKAPTLSTYDFLTCYNVSGCQLNWQNSFSIAYPPFLSPDVYPTIGWNSPLYENDQFLWFTQDPSQPDPFYYQTLANYRTIPLGSTSVMVTTTSLTDVNYFTQSDPAYWNGAYLALWHIPNEVSIFKITGYDPASHTISYNMDCYSSGCNVYTDRDSYYAVLNHINLINQPGRDFIDINAGRIYLWPYSAADLTQSISMGVTGGGMDINAKNHLEIGRASCRERVCQYV